MFSFKVVFCSFAASLLVSAWLAAAASLTLCARRQGWFFLGRSFWKGDKNVMQGQDGGDYISCMKSRRGETRTHSYLLFFLCWVMHHSVSPQAFLITMRPVKNGNYTVSAAEVTHNPPPQTWFDFWTIRHQSAQNSEIHLKISHIGTFVPLLNIIHR